MVRKVTSLLVIAGALAIAACNTVRGAAELAQGPEAAMNADPLAEVAPSGNGTDADAGEYLND